MIDAELPDADDFFSRDLYQFLDDEPPPARIFAGGHGFTGLAYIHPPDTSAEVQYSCRAQDAA